MDYTSRPKIIFLLQFASQHYIYHSELPVTYHLDQKLETLSH